MVIAFDPSGLWQQELARLNATVTQLLDATTNPVWMAGDEYARRAAMALSHGWFRDAVDDAMRSIERYPYRPFPHLVLGLAELAQGNFDAAHAAFIKGIPLGAAGERAACATMAMVAARVGEFSDDMQADLLKAADRVLRGKCPELRIEMAIRGLATVTPDEACTWLAADGQLQGDLPANCVESPQYRTLVHKTAMVLATWRECVEASRTICEALPERPDHEASCLLWLYDDKSYASALVGRNLATQIVGVRAIFHAMTCSVAYRDMNSRKGTHSGAVWAVHLRLQANPSRPITVNAPFLGASVLGVAMGDAENRPALTLLDHGVVPRRPGFLASESERRLYESRVADNREIDLKNEERQRVHLVQSSFRRPPVRRLAEQLVDWQNLVPPARSLIHPMVRSSSAVAESPSTGALDQVERDHVDAARRQVHADRVRGKRERALAAARKHRDPIELLALAALYWTDKAEYGRVAVIAHANRELWAAAFPSIWTDAEHVRVDGEDPPWNSQEIASWFGHRARLAGYQGTLHPWGAGAFPPKVWLFPSTARNTHTPRKVGITPNGKLLADDDARHLSLAALANMAGALDLRDRDMELPERS